MADWAHACELAATNAVVLDRPLGLMLERAWLGGGALAFEQDLAGRRQGLQAAWQQVLEGIAADTNTSARFTRRDPHDPFAPVKPLPPPVVAPSVRTDVGSARCYAPGAFTGVDVHAFDELAQRLRKAGPQLLSAADEVWGLLLMLIGFGHNADIHAALGRIREIAAWCDEHATDIGRRLALIEQGEAAAVGLTSAPGATGPLISSGLAANWVFGGDLADPLHAGSLIDQLAAGDATAVRALLERQRAGFDKNLAARINAAWASMTDAERAKLITNADQASLGALDGIPSAVRDQVNRPIFASEFARLLALKQQLPPGDEFDAVSKKLTGMAFIARQLDTTTGPRRLLIAFDTTGLGHAAVSIGDPDTATDLVTYTPGFNSSFGSAKGDLARMKTLYDESVKALPPGRTLSSMWWMGYDPPQGNLGANLDPTTTVIDDRSAELGATKLASFSSGLHATARPGQPGSAGLDRHVVMLGHSYGSLVTGKAAVLNKGAFADDLIFVGSPGVGVDRAADLGIPASHVFAGAASSDAVPLIPDRKQLAVSAASAVSAGPLGIPGLVADGVIGYQANKHHRTDGGAFGTNPARDAFGGVPFEVAPGTGWGSHSDYWKVRSESLANLQRIVAGHPEAVTPALDAS